MDKNINVSIAGIAFSLDSEAYKRLKDYLVRIELGYKNNPEGKEIIDDIEARVAELILNEQAADIPVKAELINHIIEQLGLPDDIKPVDEEHTDSYKSGIPRRLYRNPDGAKLGGVCNGLATYFNVEPVIVRLLFCAPLILTPIAGIIHHGHLAGFFGTLFSAAIMLYFILWFAVPKAKTPRQRLEMQGNKITASAIHQNFHEDFDEINPSPKSERNASVLADLVYVIGKVVLFCMKAFALLIGGVLALTAIGIIIALIAVLTQDGVFYFDGLWNSLEISGVNTIALVIMGLLICVLPLIIIGYLLMRLVFNLPSGRTTLSVLFGIWIIVLIYMSAITIRNFEKIRDGVRDGRIEYYFNHNRLLFDEDIDAMKTIEITGDSIQIEQYEVDGKMISDTVKLEYFTE